LAVPYLAAFLVVTRVLPGPWSLVIAYLMVFAPPLIVGILSRSTLWSMIVWLGPAAIALGIAAAGMRIIVVQVALVLTFAWTVGLMFSQRLSDLVMSSFEHPLEWLALAGPSVRWRGAYRDLLTASRRTVLERDAPADFDETARSVWYFREQARRIHALQPPDDAWAEVFNAAAAPARAYADMLEGKRPMDYDEFHRLVVHRNKLLQELLRRESFVLRILMYTPPPLGPKSLR